MRTRNPFLYLYLMNTIFVTRAIEQPEALLNKMKHKTSNLKINRLQSGSFYSLLHVVIVMQGLGDRGKLGEQYGRMANRQVYNTSFTDTSYLRPLFSCSLTEMFIDGSRES